MQVYNKNRLEIILDKPTPSSKILRRSVFIYEHFQDS